MPKDHYATLGVERDATPEQIKKTYRERAAKAHPDKQTGNAEEMASLNEAYDVLSDPKIRLLYDMTGRSKEVDEQVAIDDIIFSLFAEAISCRPEKLLEQVKASLRTMIVKTNANIREGEKIEAYCVDKCGKVSTTREANLLHMLVNKELVSVRAIMDVEKKTLDRQYKAQAILETYSSTEEVPKPKKEPRGFTIGGWNTLA